MRPKLALAGAAFAVAGAVWVAAPALSVTPYVPRAKDFEQSLPQLRALAGEGHAHAAAHRTGESARSHESVPGYISPVVEAPRRFDLVGIAGETRPIELRVREEDGTWSEWVETGSGDPVYTGGSDAVQVRTHGFRPRGDLHYVNVSGTSGGFADRLLNSARATINEAFISVASAPVAEALAPKPTFLTRSAWGADRTDGGGCIPGGPPAFGAVRAAVIHHTVSTTTYTPEEAPGMVLGICRFHRYGNGWNDIGYNALVDSYGQLYEGRAGGLRNPIVGAHTSGVNSQTTGLASLGTHTTLPITPAAESAMVRFLAWKLARHGARPATRTVRLLSGGVYPRIAGHRTYNPTSCPGAALEAQIPALRVKVQKRIKKYAKNRKRKKKRKR